MNPPRKTETNGQAARHIRLKLVGVGGAGGNAVQTLAGNPTNLAGIELLAINTDAQALDAITGAEKLPIGSAITHGLGAGGDPELGARAAQQDTEPLRAALHGADIVFLAAGLGGVRWSPGWPRNKARWSSRSSRCRSPSRANAAPTKPPSASTNLKPPPMP
jgi:cell division GTPase FtsZ